MSWVYELDVEEDVEDEYADVHHPRQWSRKDVRCDSIMKCLAEEAIMYSDDWKDSFMSMDWSRVENFLSPDYISLAEALYESVNFILTDHDASIVIQGFQTHRNKFDYKMFLHAFFTRVQELEERNESITSNVTIKNSRGVPSRSGTELWDIARRKLVSHVSSINAFTAGASEKARHRALQSLIDAIGKLQVSRFQGEEIHFTGSLTCGEFRTELRRVFGINLSRIEADSLFKTFDTDGNGTLSAKEFNDSFNQMPVEWRRRARREARERRAAQERLREKTEEQRKRRKQKLIGANQLAFNQSAYEQAVVRLSEEIVVRLGRGDNAVIAIPDGYVSEWYVQRCFKDQWDVLLSRDQVHSICMKLRGDDISPEKTLRPGSLPDISPPRAKAVDGSGEGGMILGKLIKTLVVNLRSFVSPKKKKKKKNTMG